MRLSEKQATIIASCDLRADAPIELLRKETGYREHSIRYAMRGLEVRGVIAPIPFVNLHALGFTNHNIFFSIGAEKRASKEALIKALFDTPEVVWIGEFGGEFQYGISVCSRTPSELFEFVRKLSSRFQRVFFGKEFSMQYSVTAFPRKYLSSKKFSTKPITASYTKVPIELDDLDSRILSCMATYTTFSHRQIALKMQIPLSTFELRYKKLVERGAILGKIFAINPTAFGVHQYNLLVYAKGLNTAFSQALHKFCLAAGNITYMIESLGSWDYEIIVEAERSEQATEVMQQLFDEFGAVINNIRLLPKFRDLKTRWFPQV